MLETDHAAAPDDLKSMASVKGIMPFAGHSASVVIPDFQLLYGLKNRIKTVFRLTAGYFLYNSKLQVYNSLSLPFRKNIFARNHY